MTTTLLQLAINAIDFENSKDPNQEIINSVSYPKELLYSQRLLSRLISFASAPSDELIIATRAHHICRWKTPRDSYPMDRIGYLKWREELKKSHAKTTAIILEKLGYKEAFIERVSFLIQKKSIKNDAETQVLEDIICLDFLTYYLEPFVEKHLFDKEKLTNIIVKTWNKMSEKGHQEALKIPFSSSTFQLIKEALAL